MNTTDDTTAPAPTVWPSLQARDARALIDWLVGTLGFVEAACYTDGGRVAHAQLAWPEGGGIMLGDHEPGAEWALEPGTFGAYVVTDDVDGLYAKVRAAGADIMRPLADQDYGNREFAVRDPEGNKWSFGPYRGEPVPR
ncbi:VOC family protein [Tomitella cavernea]|uniref:VOC family protein n=1 Tax=Tomitella cavernea TaxID=1387982 RepID=A0ABP9CG69_9ACTN|nr:VOC family protein [Tomitella cavernea]